MSKATQRWLGIILKNGANVNAPDSKGQKLLHLVSKRQSRGVIRLFLNSKVAVNAVYIIMYIQRMWKNVSKDVELQLIVFNLQLLIDLGLNVNNNNLEKTTCSLNS